MVRTYTPNLSLSKYDYKDTRWDLGVNDNWDILDSRIQTIVDQSAATALANTFTAANSFTQPVTGVDPTLDAHFVTRSYANSHYLQADNNITFTGTTIFTHSPSIPDPTNATDAANRQWVLNQIAAGSLSGLVSQVPGPNRIPQADNFNHLQHGWLPTVGIAAGTYGSNIAIPQITINAQGIITDILLQAPQVLWAGILDKPVTAVPTATSVPLSDGLGKLDAGWLPNSGVTANTYGAADSVPQFTVDDYGRITSVTPQAIEISATAVTSGIFGVSRLPVMVGDSGVGGIAGIVPAPPVGAAMQFLRGDGTWVSGTTALHSTTHHLGGLDALKLDDLDTPDDNTDLNASVARHGLLPKLSGIGTEVLKGDGTWGSVPAAGHAIQHMLGGADELRLDEFGLPTDVTTLNASTTYHGLLPKLSGSSLQFLNGLGGWSNIGSHVTALSTKDVDYTVQASDHVILGNASGGDITLTLPFTPLHGQVFYFKKIDSSANGVVIDGNGRDVDGAASITVISRWNAYQVEYSSTEDAWFIL